MVGGTTLGTAVGLVTFLLTSVVPQWRTGLPEQLAAALPFIVAGVGYFVGGWLAKHKATATEVANALKEAEALSPRAFGSQPRFRDRASLIAAVSPSFLYVRRSATSSSAVAIPVVGW